MAGSCLAIATNLHRLWLVCLLVSCGQGGAAPGSNTRFDVRSDGASSMPGPGRAREVAAVAENRECERCHPSEAAEWRASLHRAAATEPAYQRAFALEPMPFCRSCHAPEADPSTDAEPVVAELGVGCVTCHQDAGGAVLAVPKETSHEAPHAVVRDARFAGVGACAACHEFGFPGAVGTGSAVLMQSTVTEHALSPYASESCASCHMPLVQGRRRHDFVVSRSAEVLRAALQAVARRTSPTEITIELTSVGVGHAFPTGDLFRRLEVTAEAVGPDEMSLAQDTVWLRRRFGSRTGMTGRVLLSDNRLSASARTVVLDVGPPGVARPIAWRVAYQRVLHPQGALDSEALLEDDIPLAWGRLPPPGEGATP